MNFTIIAMAALGTITNDSVAGGDFSALVSCDLNNEPLLAIDAERSDVAVAVRVLDSDGVERVAGIDLSHGTGTDLRCWYGTVAIPAALGAGTYQLQFYQRKDIDVPSKFQKGGKLKKEIEADDMAPYTVPALYQA